MTLAKHVFARLALHTKTHVLLSQLPHKDILDVREEELQEELVHVVEKIEQKAAQGKNIEPLKQLVLELRAEFDAMKRNY